MIMKSWLTTAVITGVTAALTAGASADVTNVTVTIENLAPQFGTYQTPFWVGFHNGQFDLFNTGEAASASLERLAEDGDTSFVSADFLGSGFGSLDGVITAGGMPFAPGAISSMSFKLDSNLLESAYFSYASMVIPSNDAFIGNDNAMGYRIFDDNGSFVGADFFITGAQVYDAGSEVNDEIPMNTAFFGQAGPDIGDDEFGVIHGHPGFLGSFGNPGDPQSILADPMFAGADFTLPGYPIARITITPAPSALALLGLAGAVGLGRRRQRAATA